MNRNRIRLVLLILFSAYLFLFGLGKMPLTDPDEPFYAETAREMLNRGEWLTPIIFGKPQFEKPPLYYWLIISSYKVFGVNEFAARFPSALFGILGVIGVYLLGALLFSEKAAVYSSLVMATCVEYIILARACVTDIVLCVFILYAFLFFFYELKHSKKIFCVLSSSCLALAVLTKGPIGFVLPVFIIIVYFFVKKEFIKLFKLPIFWCLAVFAVIAVPWYCLMYKFYGNEFIGHFFGFQNITRFLVAEHETTDYIFYYVPIIIGTFFPWSVFFPCGAFVIAKKDREKFKDHLFLLIWMTVFFIFFTLSRSKLPTYVFPLYPALALVIGRFWELESDNKVYDIFFGLSAFIYLVAILACLAAFYRVALNKYPLMIPAIIKSGIIFLALSLTSLILLVQKRISLFFKSVVLTMAIGLVPLVMFLSPAVGLYESSKEFSEYLKKVVKPDEKIGAETDYGRGIAFYLKRDDILDVHRHHIITKFLLSKERVWAVIKDKNHQQLYTDKKNPFHLPTYVIYKFGKKVIITNKAPDDGKYIKRRSINEPT